MTTTSISQSRQPARRTVGGSRIGTIVAKELDDHFKRNRLGLLHAIMAVSIVPAAAFMLDDGSATAIADSNMRVNFPLLFGTMLGASSVSMAFGPSLKDGATKTLEPVLTTSLRRMEFVLGKFLALAILWTGFMALQVAMLGLFTLPFIHGRFAMFGYFHPRPLFWIELPALLISTWLMLAAAGFLLSTCKRRLQIPIFLGTLSVLAVLVGSFHELWPLTAITPYFNLTNGLANLFAELPYDPRVQPLFFSLGLPYHPHTVAITIAASTVMAALFLWLTVRRFERHTPDEGGAAG